MVSAVVLAAGASTRMGRPKLLLTLAGEPLVRRTVRQVCSAGFDEVLVVVGHEASRTEAALEGLPVRIARNPDYRSGLGSSFRVAVSQLDEQCEAAMFVLADQPFVTGAEYRRVLDTYRDQAPPIVCVRYGEVTAPPHLFARELFPELMRLERGARPVIERHRARAVTLELPPDLLVDVDTPEDYERATARVGGA